MRHFELGSMKKVEARYEGRDEVRASEKSNQQQEEEERRRLEAHKTNGDDLDKEGLIKDEPDLDNGFLIGGDDKNEPSRIDDDFNGIEDMDSLDEEEDLDNWLDEEDIGDDLMLKNMYRDQNRQNDLDHGFGGKDDDGFRGLDSNDSLDGPSAEGFDFDGYDLDMDMEIE